MKRSLAWLFVLGMAAGSAGDIGCAGSHSALQSRSGSTVEETAARSEITALVKAQYAAVERGDLVTWAEPFAPDVLLIGTDPQEATQGRDKMLASLQKAAAGRMSAEVKRQYRSRRLLIGLAPGARAGWIADEIDYTLQSPAGKKHMIFRMTGVVAKQNQRWQITVAHYSLPVEDSRALSTPATPWPLPAELEARESGAAQEIANLISTAPQDHFPVPFSDRADVLLVGTSAAEWISGGPQSQRFTSQDKPGRIEVARRGPVSAGVTEDSQVAWAAWNASLTVPTAAQRITLPVRVLSVFLREQSQWRKVQEHVSLAVVD